MVYIYGIAVSAVDDKAPTAEPRLEP